MTDERRLELDQIKLESAEIILQSARNRLLATGADPFWGPIVAELGVVVKILDRHLVQEERRLIDLRDERDRPQF